MELIGGVSRKVLPQTLRRLQASGIVERRVYAEAPPRVEFSLTEFGRTLEQPIAMLTEWARSNGEAVARSQEAGTAAADAAPAAAASATGYALGVSIRARRLRGGNGMVSTAGRSDGARLRSRGLPRILLASGCPVGTAAADPSAYSQEG